MSNLDDFKSSSKKRMEELLTKYEAVRTAHRKKESNIQEQLQEHVDQMDRLKNELEDKYKRIEHFGGIAAEELSDAFFTSAEAFSDSIDKIKNSSD